jgi:hypothetical protein
MINVRSAAYPVIRTSPSDSDSEDQTADQNHVAITEHRPGQPGKGSAVTMIKTAAMQITGALAAKAPWMVARKIMT